MDDGDLRGLCHQYFDALEQGDIDDAVATFAPGFTCWENVPGKVSSVEETRQRLADELARARRRTYDDRLISTFANGFVVQYSINVVGLDGTHRSLWACLVAQCRGGQITHIDEYLDSSKFGENAVAGAAK